MESLRVFVFSSGFGLPTMGPFALKLESWLRMAGIPYERIYEDDSRKGPKGKNPWIEINGESMADTELIIERLSGELGIDLDSHLSPRERATATAVTRMVEEHLHQILEWELFIDENGWRLMSLHADRILPPLVGAVMKRMMRGHFRKQLHARGIGRHDRRAIASMALRDLESLSELIGDGPYLFGDHPCVADAAVFGQLAVLASVPAEAPAMLHTRQDPVLRSYVGRFLNTFFSDHEPSQELTP